MEAKMRRNNPLHIELIEAMFLQEQQSKGIKLNVQELKEFCEKNLLGKVPNKIAEWPKYEYIDLRYFSEYMPQLGFTCGVEFIHSMPSRGLFFIVMSIMPPGRRFLSTNGPMGLNQTHAAQDVQTIHKIDFESPLKAITFTDNIKEFYITQPSPSTLMVFEIFEAKVSSNKIDKVDRFGFSVLPLFQYVEVDGDLSDSEVYINTSISQVPVFPGAPDETFMRQCQKNTHMLNFLSSYINENKMEPHKSTSLVIQLKDNQFEDMFKNKEVAMDKLSSQYMLVKKPKNYKINYRKDYMNNKSNQIKKALPKKMNPEDYEAMIYDYITTNIN